jgi:hypothetical protein
MDSGQKTKIAYGFIVDNGSQSGELPEDFLNFLEYASLILASKDVKFTTGKSIDFLYTLDLLIFGVYKKLDYEVCCNQIVIFISDSASLYGDSPALLDITVPEQDAIDQLDALSGLFHCKTGWISFAAP